MSLLIKSFSGIVSDLFPRLVEEAVDYGILEKSIRTNITQMGLEDVDGNYDTLLFELLGYFFLLFE